MKKFLLLLLFITLISAFAVYHQFPDKKLHIIICDVGQGDGILITKGSNQIVIDAGPDNSIESCLGSHMPFWDKTIEVALMTHADADHSTGFIEMAKRYKINRFIGSSIDTNTKTFTELKKILKEKNISELEAKNGVEAKADGVDFKIIYPTESFLSENTKSKNSNVLGSKTASNTNDFCAVSHVKYGNFTGIFACDTSPISENTMLSQDLVTYAYFLKVPHHGSKNGLTENFLKAVNPKITAISVGTKNRYGHPSPEIIDMLKNFGVKTYRTDQDGEIEIITDGKKVWVKK